MRFYRKFIFTLGLFCGINTPCFASDLVLDDASTDENVIAIYGAACEKIKSGEAKSSVRVRATDKASFEAVGSISELAPIKKDLDQHDFNVMIYDLVDNYVEDMAVRTTKQDENNLCVEVTGYLKKDNIVAVVKETFDGKAGANFSEAERNSVERDEEKPFENPENIINDTSLVTEEKNILNDAIDSPEVASENKEEKISIFVMPTVFFNETQSETHAQTIKDVLKRSSSLALTAEKNGADFLIKSNVLRAKIDPINSNTSRLQMVVSVTIENMQNKTSSTEHQNRFVLFSSSDDEQKVATTLMRQLFEKATEAILPILEKESRADRVVPSLPQMITPSNLKTHPETDEN